MRKNYENTKEGGNPCPMGTYQLLEANRMTLYAYSASVNNTRWCDDKTRSSW